MLYKLPTTMAVAAKTAPMDTASPTARVLRGMGAVSGSRRRARPRRRLVSVSFMHCSQNRKSVRSRTLPRVFSFTDYRRAGRGGHPAPPAVGTLWTPAGGSMVRSKDETPACRVSVHFSTAVSRRVRTLRSSRRM